VPLCDGAAEVLATGPHVTRFAVGDRVLLLFNQGHLSGSLDGDSIATGVGSAIDGALRQYGTYDESGLVAAPKNLSWLEASTLGCAGVTAWNALFGLEGRVLKRGEAVLTQGTGGVSCFAIQVRSFFLFFKKRCVVGCC
jgi:NADPH:quinone reductase-like Zn-dependent oxidoreductase